MEILNSWKEIAGYLGRGVRTVQRWERELGLPVHRPKGRERSAVLAFPEELQQWLQKTPMRSCDAVPATPPAWNWEPESQPDLPSPAALAPPLHQGANHVSNIGPKRLTALVYEAAQRQHSLAASLMHRLAEMTGRTQSRSTSA